MTSQDLQEKPLLGATFYPGGSDDFMMPELISPSPQRVMPEVPSSMQEGLARLELEANELPSRNRMSSMSTVSSLHDDYEYYSRPSPMSPPNPGAVTGAVTVDNDYRRTFTPQQPPNTTLPNLSARKKSGSHDVPFPSPFPRVENAGRNIPDSAEEKEAVLENAMEAVLDTQDWEMQLKWAQDTLGWVEDAEEDRVRSATGTGQRASTPNREHNLRTAASNIISHLAAQSHPHALFLKGLWHEFGRFGYAQDRQESFSYYRQAAEQGYARAEYRIGTSYEKLNDMSKAIKHYNVGVLAEDSPSLYRMGMMTLLGQHGQEQDFIRGIDLVRRSAETADENAPQGAYIYGFLLANELPHIDIPTAVLPVDVGEAKKYIEKAAYLGFAKAQLRMGQAYEYASLLCEFDAVLSLHYLALAARQGDSEAEMGVSKWFLCGFENKFEKNEELAFEYARRATQNGLASAQFALGYFYEVGIHVRKDLGQAEIWYRKAANQGNADAISRLEGLQQHKTLSRTDHESIAITRIKSQHGSLRGKRPDRLRGRRSPLPVMAEERLGMPEVQPVRHSGAGSSGAPTDPRHARTGSAGGTISLPPVAPLRPRSSSTAPYPEDDVAPGPRANVRVSPSDQSLRPLPGPPADRPGSAFGIRTLQPQGVPQGPRPATSIGNIGVPDGRQTSPDPRNRAPMPTAGWGAQIPPGYGRNISPNRPPIGSVMGTPRPLENGPIAKTRLHKPPSDATRPQRPLLNPPLPAKEPSYPMTAGPMIQPRYSSAPSRPLPEPYERRAGSQSNSDRFEYPPQNSSRTSQKLNSVDIAPPAPLSQPLPHRMPSTPPSVSPAPPTQSKPPRGPQTFEEMGIPHHKKEDPCCIM